MRLGDIHPDMDRYLREDCYCPGEIYDSTGLFYRVYGTDEECTLLAKSDDMTAVIATTSCHGKEDPTPQAILFWHDDGSGRIIGAQRFDATENNVGILVYVVNGGKPDGRKIDEYVPGSTASEVSRVLSWCNGLVIAD